MLSLPTPRSGVTVLAASAAVLSMGALAVPAHAAAARPQTAVTTQLLCSMDDFYDFDCSAFTSGGTGVYTETWGGSYYTLLSSSPGSMVGHCGAGSTVTVTYTVVDSGGGSAARSRTFTCGQAQ